RTNRTGAVIQTSRVPAWSGGDTAWRQVVDCVRTQFSRFNVDVTDVDPGSRPHYEAVLGGSYTDLGIEPAGGMATTPGTCDGVIPNGISFVFTELYAGDVGLICEAAAQEVAHNLGLDHAYLCADPMSYLEGCGRKSFQDVEARCGEYAPE